MRVIQFPQWPVYCHMDTNGRNTIRRWLDQNAVSIALRYALQNQIDLVAHNGLESVPGCIVSVSNDLEAFKGVRKGEKPVYLIFRRGLFAEQEITLLAATHIPKESINEARRILREIECDRSGRRRYESITRPLAR